MESEWDTLRALGAVTAVGLLLWAIWGVSYTVYVYLLPQARRGSPWLRAHGSWAGEGARDHCQVSRGEGRRKEDR